MIRLNFKTLISLVVILQLLGMRAVAFPNSGLYNNESKNDKKNNILYGEVYDSFTRMPLEAKVFLLDKDSMILDSTICVIQKRHSNYTFSFNQGTRSYIIKAVYQGYENCYQNLDIRAFGRNHYYSVPQHLMKKNNDIYKNVDLDEIQVKATKIQVTYHGDTIIYDASAFVLPEGSMLDALIRQMPGAELKDNGEVYINGQKVDYLTLNGKDFFRGKNQIMLENLPYYIIKNIKVYNKERSEVERYTSNIKRKDFVMDVKLKRKYAKGYLGNAEIGAGTDNRWLARLFGLLTGEHTDMAIFGNTNNINENRIPGHSGNWSPSTIRRGIRTTNQAGLYLQTEDKDKTQNEELDALVEWSDDDIEKHTYNEIFSSDGNITKNGTSSVRNKKFKANLTNTFRLFQPIMLISQYSLNYNNTKLQSSKRDSTFREHLINQISNYTDSQIDDFNTNLHLNIAKRLSWGDLVSLSIDGGYNSQKPNNTNYQNITKYVNPNETDNRNYLNDSQQHGYHYKAELNYIFSLPQYWQISPYIGFHQFFEARVNHNYLLEDYLNIDEADILPSYDAMLTQVFDNKNSYHYNDVTKIYTGGINITTGTENSFFNIGLPVNIEKERISYTHISLDTIAHRSIVLFEPNISYNRYGRNKRHLSYRMRMEKPNYALLMPFKDDTNPLIIRINNSHLSKKIQHEFSTNATFHPDSTEQNYWVSFVAKYIYNAWGTRTIYNSGTGAFTYINDNVKEGNWNANLQAGLQCPLDHKRRLNLDIDGNIKFEHNVDFDISYKPEYSSLSRVNTLSAGIKASLKYRMATFIIGAISKLSGRFSHGNRTDFENIHAADYQYGVNLQYTIPTIRLTLTTDINIYGCKGYNNKMMNTDDLVWNAQLTYPLAKGKIIAKLQAFDILHQLSNKSYSVNAQGRTEIWYNSIPRYAILSFAFKFNRNKKN